MDFTTARELSSKARAHIEDVQRQLDGDEAGVNEARERAAKAEAACRSADPDSGAFEKLVQARAVAEHRIAAMEDRAARSRKALDDAQAAAVAAHEAMIGAEFAEVKRAAAAADAELIAFVRTAREEARAKLARLEGLLRRANECDVELNEARGTPIPGYLLPRHYNTHLSMIVASTEKNILEHLEGLVDDKDHANRRGLDNRAAVSAVTPK